MNIDDLTIGDAKKLAAMFGGGESPSVGGGMVGGGMVGGGMVGEYVIARCRDAGVHAGTLVSTNGRECVLSDSRRLWYWKPANEASFLSGVATEGLHKDSKVGAPVKIHLTENCEIILCSDKAAESIRGAKNHEA